MGNPLGWIVVVEFSSGRSLFLVDGFQIFFSCLRYPTRRGLSLFSSARYYLLFYMSTRCYLFFYMSMSHVKKNIVRDHLKIKINQPKNYVEGVGGLYKDGVDHEGVTCCH